jgi:predicted N-acetyltransferase YhbS
MLRNYGAAGDFELVGDFLTRHYRPGNRDGNWFQPVWEYAHTHPWFDEAALDRIGIWEVGGEVVGMATYELRLGEAFFHTHPDYGSLKGDMLIHAEAQLVGTDDAGRRYLKAFVNDFDGAFVALVAGRGYERQPGSDRPISQLAIPTSFPPIRLPEGFHLQSLADENDLRKVHRVLHRGFNHAGEPPEEGIEGRRKMQSGPHFRHDLTIVAVAPDGDYVAFCGMWLDATNRLAYVEPVATDPDYRRRGLGSAVVLEGVRRCSEDGASVAYVGTDTPFYRSIGFRRLHTQECWVKRFQ